MGDSLVEPSEGPGGGVPRAHRAGLASRWTHLLGAAAGVALVVGIVWRVRLMLGGELGFDEGVYWQSLRSMAHGHPLFSSTYSSQPPTFLDSAYVVWALLGRGLVAARAAVLIWAVVGAAAVAWLAGRIAGTNAALVALAATALEPLATRGSVMLGADLPAAALGVTSVALTVEARRRTGRTSLVLAAVAGIVLAAAVLVKLFAVAFVPAILWALLGPSSVPGPRDVPSGRLRLLGLGIAGGVVGTVAFLAPHLGAAGAMWEQVVAGHLTARDLPLGGFTHDVVRGLRYQAVPALMTAVAIGGLLPRRPAAAGLVFLVLGGPVLFLLSLKPLWAHHLVLLWPGLAVGAGVTVALLMAQPRRWLARGAALAVVLAIGAGCLLTGRAQSVYPESAAAVRHVRAAVPPGAFVASDDPFEAAAAGRDVPPDLVDPSAVRIGTGALTTARTVADLRRWRVNVVVFSTGKFNQLPGFRAWVREHYPRRRHYRDITIFSR